MDAQRRLDSDGGGGWSGTLSWRPGESGVTDSEGKTWIDVHGGYGSVNLGYGRPEIAEAVREQMLKISYFPNGTTTEPLIRLTEKLAQITPGDLERTWAVTGGSEANETSVKIARAYHRRNGEPGRYKIISRRGSYHGATGGTIFLGGRAPNTERSNYEPANLGMIHAPQPNPYRCELGGRLTLSARSCAPRPSRTLSCSTAPAPWPPSSASLKARRLQAPSTGPWCGRYATGTASYS